MTSTQFCSILFFFFFALSLYIFMSLVNWIFVIVDFVCHFLIEIFLGAKQRIDLD